MAVLPPPAKRYLMGKLPTHSSSSSLHENFEGLDAATVRAVLGSTGHMDSQTGKPLKQALTDELLDRCEKSVLWNLEKVAELFEKCGMTVSRRVVNQQVKEPEDGEPKWVNLGTVATYFNVSANAVGKWLDELGLRDGGLGSQKAMDEGLATVTEMNAGGNKTRQISMWNLYPVQMRLIAAGHELDFDYEKVMKGTGKNSDVGTDNADNRAREFIASFKECVADERRRKWDTRALVKAQPIAVLRKAEEILKRPGFFTRGGYEKFIR